MKRKTLLALALLAAQTVERIQEFFPTLLSAAA